MADKRPLLNSAPLSEFGDLPVSETFLSPTGMGGDISYVPGFSDMRRERDLAVAEYQHGRRTAANVPTLPVNLRWARAQKSNGATDTTKTFIHAQKGYRLVNAKEHSGKEWLKELPPGCEEQADGSIRRGDTVLMVCDQKSAARSEASKRQQTDVRLHGVTEAFKMEMERRVTAEKVSAASPTITKEKSEK